jgi:hypothetical protein
MVRARIARVLLPAISLSHMRLSGDAESAKRLKSHLPADSVVWGCESAMPSKGDTLDPRWRDQLVVVWHFGLVRTATLKDAWRRHPHRDVSTSRR